MIQPLMTQEEIDNQPRWGNLPLPMHMPIEYIEKREITVAHTRQGWRVSETNEDNPEFRKLHNLPAGVVFTTILDYDVQAKILDALGIDYK